MPVIIQAMMKLPALIMVIALLVTNTAHAECSASGLCDDAQVIKSTDSSNNQNHNQQSAECDGCATCGHHHHVHAFLSSIKATHTIDASSTIHGLHGGDRYLSQQHAPPYKPPKA